MLSHQDGLLTLQIKFDESLAVSIDEQIGINDVIKVMLVDPFFFLDDSTQDKAVARIDYAAKRIP